LKGKIVVLDFWTFCCCDCLHFLPVLEHLESWFEKETGLVFIGIHSGKFEAEKDDVGIQKAIIKNSIKHPVVNDNQMKMWKAYGSKHWPTVIVINPNGDRIKMWDEIVPQKDLETYIEATLDFYNENIDWSEIKRKLEIESYLSSKDLEKSSLSIEI